MARRSVSVYRRRPISSRCNNRRRQPFQVCTFATTSTPREEHERRVAAAQALVRERRRQHEEKVLQDQERAEGRRKDSQRRHALVNSVSHWLTKDPSFFLATMDALNLTSQVSTIPNNHNQDHPIQVVWDQYRQLYYDSIPTFRKLLEESSSSSSPLPSLNDNNNAFDFHDEMKMLEDAGFEDPQWAKRYRKVRGHQVRENNIMRQAANAKVELDRRRQTVRKAQAEVSSLKQEMEQLEMKRQERLKKLEVSQREDDDNDSSSIFTKAWSMLSSIFVPSTAVTQKKGPDQDLLLRNRIPTTSRIEKRIARKEWEVKQFQEYAEEASAKLIEIQERRKQRSSPMSQEEYNRANKIVDQVRTSICGKLAQHIRQRHEKLIQQFQTLDSKTGKKKRKAFFY